MRQNVADCPKAGNLSLIHFLHARDTFLQCGEDFDTLNGVDAEICFKSHGRFQHLFGVAGFFGNQSKKNWLEVGGWRRDRFLMVAARWGR